MDYGESRDDVPGGWLDFVTNEGMIKCSNPNNQDKQFYFEALGNILYVESIYDIVNYVYPRDDTFFVDYDAIRIDGYNGVNFDISSLKEAHDIGPNPELDIEMQSIISKCEQRFIDDLSCDSLVVWNPDAVVEVPEMIVQIRRGDYNGPEMQEWIRNNQSLVQECIDNDLISFGHIVKASGRAIDTISKFSPTGKERDEA